MTRPKRGASTQATNGHAGPGPFLRMPVRTMQIEMEGDYAGFAVTMHSNPPMRVLTEIQSGTDFDGLRERIGALILDWNFTDRDGQAIATGDFDSISIDLFTMIVTRYLSSMLGASSVPKV